MKTVATLSLLLALSSLSPPAATQGSATADVASRGKTLMSEGITPRQYGSIVSLLTKVTLTPSGV